MSTLRDYAEILVELENGEKIDVTEYVVEASIEFNDSLIDMVELIVSNPGLVHSKNRLFRHGRKVYVYAKGDDGTSSFMGGYEIYRINDERGTNDIGPILNIVAYTRDILMKSVEPKDSEDRTDSKSKNHVKVWKDVSDWADVVREVLNKSAYKFNLDIDSAKNAIVSTRPHAVQTSSMNDFKFITLIANYNRYLFWVDCDEDGQWTAHFKNPDNAAVQYQEITFKYDHPDCFIEKFDGESIFDGVSEIKVQYIDPKTSLLTTVVVSGLDDPTRDSSAQDAPGELGSQLNKDPNYIYEITLDLGNFSHRVYIDKIFTSQQEAKQWAEKFYRENNESLVQTNIEIPMIKELRAMQVHVFENFYDIWDGNHYFHKVRHIFSKDSAYTEIGTRKVPTKDQSLQVSVSTEDSL